MGSLRAVAEYAWPDGPLVAAKPLGVEPLVPGNDGVARVQPRADDTPTALVGEDVARQSDLAC
jgi:hypothetical protein